MSAAWPPLAELVPHAGPMRLLARVLEHDARATRCEVVVADSALFQQAGASSGRPVVVYCHIGQQASLLFVAAKLLGHDVRLYDGSYEDWSRRTELGVETGGGGL